MTTELAPPSPADLTPSVTHQLACAGPLSAARSKLQSTPPDDDNPVHLKKVVKPVTRARRQVAGDEHDCLPLPSGISTVLVWLGDDDRKFNLHMAQLHDAVEASKNQSEGDLAAAMSPMFASLFRNDDLYLVDTHKSKSRTVPDAHLFKYKNNMTEKWDRLRPDEMWLYSHIVIEYKAMHVTLDSKDALAQAIDYARQMLQCCPTRHVAPVILTNGHTCRIVVAIRSSSSSSGPSVHASRIITMKDALIELLGVVCLLGIPSTLPAKFFEVLKRPDESKISDGSCYVADLEVEGWKVRILGGGATAVAYSIGNKDGVTCCVKIFKPFNKNEFRIYVKEQETLADFDKMPIGANVRMALPKLVTLLDEVA